MKYKLEFSKEAANDLDRIFEYISITLAVPQSAKKILAEIEKQIRRLTEHPFMCPRCLETPLYELGYRKLVVNNNVVIYDVNEREKTVSIVRIFGSRQNYVRFF